ncbi:unnamed protein product [Schistosoma spindalis]|nr:unnamed protein product [Schistosoma spindale]
MYKVVWRQLSELICIIETETNGQAKILSWDNNNHSNQPYEIQFRVKISPNEGLYAHAEYEFEIIIRLEHYGETPVVRCMSHIYHPNIEDYDIGGAVCLNLLQNWNIGMGLKAIINGLLFLFYEPNEQDPINEHFIIPSGSSFQQAVIESLQGGSYSHYSGLPNKAWCIWYNKNKIMEQKNSIDISKKNNKPQKCLKDNYSKYLGCNVHDEVIDQHLHEETDEQYDCEYPGDQNNSPSISSEKQNIELNGHYNERDSITSTPLIFSNLSSISTLQKESQSVQSYFNINEELRTMRKMENNNLNVLNYVHHLSTINLKEITIIWTNINKPMNVTYYFMETCNYAWNSQCEQKYYGHLNIGLPYIFITHLNQKSISQQVSFINEYLIKSQNNSNEKFEHFNNCNDSTISLMDQRMTNVQTMYLQDFNSMKWMFYTTRWPSFLVPGRMITENFLKPNWALPFRRASTKQLFDDLNRYILSVKWAHSSQIFIIDPLALSPFSPIALRIIYDHNEPQNDKWIYVSEWLSPWHSSTISTAERGRFPGISIFCWLAFISNWISYLSRYELYHTCLGYSRPETTIFSKACRLTEPFGSCYTFSHSLTCGQISLFDGWILWLSSLMMQQITKFSVKLLDYINKKYIKCLPVCRLSSTYNPFNGSSTAIYVFTDVDEI